LEKFPSRRKNISGEKIVLWRRRVNLPTKLMFITVQHYIIQTTAIQHIELVSPIIQIHISGRDSLKIDYATKADAESAFKRIAGALEAKNTEIDGTI